MKKFAAGTARSPASTSARTSGEGFAMPASLSTSDSRGSFSNNSSYSLMPGDGGDVATAPEDVFVAKRNLVCNTVASARVFLSPENLRTRVQLHGYLDAFKARVEDPYTRCMRAAGGDDAAAEWGSMCGGLKELDAYLVSYASRAGPFFLGHEPSLAEAATAPALFRMLATLPVIRDLDLQAACEEMGLARMLQWIQEILARPADCCDVANLTPGEHVALARKVHVRYEGPPSPSDAPRASAEEAEARRLRDVPSAARSLLLHPISGELSALRASLQKVQSAQELAGLEAGTSQTGTS